MRTSARKSNLGYLCISDNTFAFKLPVFFQRDISSTLLSSPTTGPRIGHDCLIGIIEYDFKIVRPIMQVMRILGSSLLTPNDIMEFFTPSKDEEKTDDGQLKIDLLYD